MQDNNKGAELSLTVVSAARKTGELVELYFETYAKANEVLLKLETVMFDKKAGVRVSDDFGQIASFDPECLAQLGLMDYGRRFKAHESIQVLKKRAEVALQRRMIEDPVLKLSMSMPEGMPGIIPPHNHQA